jgi:hypothetical protein
MWVSIWVLGLSFLGLHLGIFTRGAGQNERVEGLLIGVYGFGARNIGKTRVFSCGCQSLSCLGLHLGIFTRGAGQNQRVEGLLIDVCDFGKRNVG